MVVNNPDTLVWTQDSFKSNIEINETIEELKKESITWLNWINKQDGRVSNYNYQDFKEDDYRVTIIEPDLDELIKEEDQKLFNRMMHLYCLKMIGPIKPDTNISEYARQRKALNFKKGTEAYYEMLCLINNPEKLKAYLEKYDN